MWLFAANEQPVGTDLFLWEVITLPFCHQFLCENILEQKKKK